MIYENLTAFGGDHPRLFKKFLAAWESAQEGIKQLTYNKRNRSMWVEAKSSQALNELHTRRPNTRTRVTVSFDNSAVMEEQLRTRRRRQGRDADTGEYKGWS